MTLAEACESIDFTLHRNQALSERICIPCGLRVRNAAELYNFIKRSVSSDRPEGENIEAVEPDATPPEKMAHGEPGIEETKTVKSYLVLRCRFYSVSGWV